VKLLRRIAWTALLLITLAVFLAGLLVLSLDLSVPALHFQSR
jgi:hypothetical protein